MFVNNCLKKLKLVHKSNGTGTLFYSFIDLLCQCMPACEINTKSLCVRERTMHDTRYKIDISKTWQKNAPLNETIVAAVYFQSQGQPQMKSHKA